MTAVSWARKAPWVGETWALCGWEAPARLRGPEPAATVARLAHIPAPHPVHQMQRTTC